MTTDIGDDDAGDKGEEGGIMPVCSNMQTNPFVFMAQLTFHACGVLVVYLHVNLCLSGAPQKLWRRT